jgi:hypothetical protein
MRVLIAVAIVAFSVSVAIAGAPQVGVYLSLTQGGPVLDGRFSESWVGVGGPGQFDNTVNAESWDTGLGLGTEWRFYCPAIGAAPVLIEDTRDGNGTGDVVYQTEYVGGHFWLSKSGAWGDGSEDYVGDLDLFSVETTYKYVAGVVLGIRSNITLSGHFLGYDNCLNYAITNASFFGNTDDNGPLPAGFPAFLNSSCQDNVLVRGGWGSVTQIALQITGSCVVGTEEPTWGGVKARYR